MRLSFMVIVLFAAMLLWKFAEHQVSSTPKEVIVKQALPMDISYERMEARSYLNSIRESMQMQRLEEDDRLQAAAQAHADYLVSNNAFGHEEREGAKYFTGRSPAERAFHAGYHSSQVIENLSTKNNSAHSSVDGLFSAIYHRFGFLNPGIDEIGVGVTQDAKETDKSAFIYVMGNSQIDRLCSGKSFRGSGKYIYKVCKESEKRIKERVFYGALNYNKRNNPRIILYPYDGQKEIPPAFYAEVPDPLPDYEVSGFPISVEFNDHFFHGVKMDSFKLYTEGGEEVTDVRLMDSSNDPHKQFTNKQYALFPLYRLEYDTEYRVEVKYILKAKQETLIWHFHTQKPIETLHTVTQKEGSLHLASGKSHVIYFRPLDPHDILKDIQFPYSMDIRFIDNNTIILTLPSEGIERFDIVSDTRILHVEVE